MDVHIESDTSTPPLHTLPRDVRKSLNRLLETFKSQFAQDETNVGTTHLTQYNLTWVTQNLSCRSHTPLLSNTITG